MAVQMQISTKFSAIDAVSSVLNKMGSAAEQATKKISGVTAGLGGKFDAITSKIGGNIQSLAGNIPVIGQFTSMLPPQAVGLLGIATAGAAAAKAVFDLANATSQYGDNVAKTARSLGLTTDALQEFRYIGERSGVSVDEMDVALRKLTVNLGSASAETIQTLGRLGLSVEDMKAAGPDEALNMVADGMARIGDPTERAAIAVDLFGRNGVKMVNVLSEGRAGLSDLAQEAHRVGYVMDESFMGAAESLNDNILNMQAAQGSVGRIFGAESMGGMDRAVRGITEAFVGLQPAMQAVAKVFGGIVTAVGTVVQVVVDLLQPAFAVIGAILAPIGAAFEAVGIVIGAIGDAIMTIFEPISSMFTDMFGGAGDEFNILLEMAKGFATVIGAVAKVVSFVLSPVFKVIGGIIGFIKEVIGAVGDFLEWVWKTLIQPIVDVIDSVGDFLGGGGPEPATAGVPIGTGATSRSVTESRSTVDVNLNNLPAGTSVQRSGAAPGITVNTGRGR